MSELKIENQRLRNLTTGRLHTKVSHIYEDLETITGIQGLFTHMLPNALRAAEPWLKRAVTEPSFWNDEYDPQHFGFTVIAAPTRKDQERIQQRYMTMTSPLKGKKVIAAVVG